MNRPLCAYEYAMVRNRIMASPAVQIKAAQQGSSKALIEAALVSVRKRFLQLVTDRFAPDSYEHDVAKYRMKRLFDSTVGGGKNARSVLALDSFRALNPHATTSELHKMAECGSLLEMVQSFYIIIDDVMDEAETRRGKPCWYKYVGIGVVERDGLSSVGDLDVFDDASLRNERSNRIEPDCLFSIIRVAYIVVVDRCLETTVESVD
ncbi:unnamed protein product [Heligmosomoides polygyrus]|uniref:Farnesyl pyrophosphate synthase n=1 Tax=Heligmosomoides polygyrus TaxID=6339 RepID=A0A183GAK3_HELPZ|nr:unnamed protein product [Heligmosomoides polygyrus]